MFQQTKPETAGQAIINPLVKPYCVTEARERVRATPPPIASLSEFFTFVLFIYDVYFARRIFFLPVYAVSPFAIFVTDIFCSAFFNNIYQNSYNSIVSLGRNNSFFIVTQ